MRCVDREVPTHLYRHPLFSRVETARYVTCYILYEGFAWVQGGNASRFLYEIRLMGRLRVSEVGIITLEARKGQVLRELSGSTGVEQDMVVSPGSMQVGIQGPWNTTISHILQCW